MRRTSRALCRGVRRGSICALCLFILLAMLPPARSVASPQQQVQDAVNLLEQQEYAQALALLHALENSLPDPTQLSTLLAVAYLGRGYQLLSTGNFPASRDAFLEGRRYNEDDVRLWQGEAMAWFKEGRYAEAASLLDQSLAFASQNAALYQLLGQAYYADGRMFEAVQALTKAKELGDSQEITQLLEKVRREWLVEQEMGQAVRGHFQLSFVDGQHTAELAVEILEILEEAYVNLGSVLDFYPDVRVPVLLYSEQDFSIITQSPDWAGAMYDGKIRLPLGGIRHMTDQLAALLYHEYAHVIVHFLANRQAPVWINEGLAELSGRRLSSPPLIHLPQAAKENQLLSWDALAASFAALDDKVVPLAYEQSYSIVAFMIDRYGWHKMSELLERIGKRQEWRSAVAAVYHDHGLDWPAILVEWQAGLIR